MRSRRRHTRRRQRIEIWDISLTKKLPNFIYLVEEYGSLEGGNLAVASVSKNPFYISFSSSIEVLIMALFDFGS